MRKNISGREYAASKYNTFVVKESMQLMEFLMKQMNGISRNKVKDILAGHGVFVDRKMTSQYDFCLRPGMIVQVSKHRRKTELNSKFVKIVYEDKHIIVIEKATGILSMAATAKQFCVKTVLDEYFERRHFPCRAHVVHRLDRETSGLMIYAKSIEVERILEDNWQNIVTDRRYVAVVSGKMEQEGGTVRSWLKDNKAYITYSSDTDNGGKYAVTHYRRLQANDQYTLVELKLETGRKNQIRVHMKDLGYPVIGDEKYGNGTNPIKRLALHAYRLHFIHPVTSEPMDFETPFPASFLRLFTSNHVEEKTNDTSF